MKWKHIMSAIIFLVCPMLALASVSNAPEVPSWAAATLGLLATVAGVVAHIDAQVSEEYKHKWPWWLRVLWDFLAGNYKHSQNLGSS